MAPSTRQHMHTEEYRKFSYTATYTALHIYMKTQSRGTHPCVLFIWLSKECSIYMSVYLYGCPRSVEGICMYAKVCLFRVCCCVYVKTCIYCAHLCGFIDVHVSCHDLSLIKACQHVHICCSSLITHSVLFLCK